MTNDEQRAMINRIVNNLLDTLDEGKTVIKEFRKVYGGDSSANNVDSDIKKFIEVGEEKRYLGLPNLVKNVIDKDGNLLDEYKKEEVFETTFTIEKEVTVTENGKEVTTLVPEEITESETKEVPNTDAMSEVTNRAMALTHAFALFIELNKMQDELDEKSKLIEELEERVSNLERDINYLMSGH